MAKLILQRVNLQAFRQKYVLYINRIKVGEIGFAEQFELDLEPGRYQLSAGGFFAREAEVWFEMEGNNRAFEIQSEGISLIKNWPKYHGLKLVAKGPIQLRKEDQLIRLKRKANSLQWKQLAFNIFYLAALGFLFVLGENDNFIYLLIALFFINLVAINAGIRKRMMKGLDQKDHY